MSLRSLIALYSRLHSVNCNKGPGSSEWFGIESKYVPIMRQAILDEFEVDILRDEGLWYPNPEWLNRLNIPYFHGIQKAGDVVVLKGDTLHWVRSLGFSVHFSWNFGLFDSEQINKALDRYYINEKFTDLGPTPYQNVVPFRTLLYDLVSDLMDNLDSSQEEETGNNLPLIRKGIDSEQVSSISTAIKENDELILNTSVLTEHNDDEDFNVLRENWTSSVNLKKSTESDDLNKNQYSQNSNFTEIDIDNQLLNGSVCNNMGKTGNWQMLKLNPKNSKQSVWTDCDLLLRLIYELILSIYSFEKDLTEASKITGLTPQQEAKGSIVVYCELPNCKRELFEAYLDCSDCGFICLQCVTSGKFACKSDISALNTFNFSSRCTGELVDTLSVSLKTTDLICEVSPAKSQINQDNVPILSRPCMIAHQKSATLVSDANVGKFQKVLNVESEKKKPLYPHTSKVNRSVLGCQPWLVYKSSCKYMKSLLDKFINLTVSRFPKLKSIIDKYIDEVKSSCESESLRKFNTFKEQAKLLGRKYPYSNVEPSISTLPGDSLSVLKKKNSALSATRVSAGKVDCHNANSLFPTIQLNNQVLSPSVHKQRMKSGISASMTKDDNAPLPIDNINEVEYLGNLDVDLNSMDCQSRLNHLINSPDEFSYPMTVPLATISICESSAKLQDSPILSSHKMPQIELLSSDSSTTTTESDLNQKPTFRIKPSYWNKNKFKVITLGKSNFKIETCIESSQASNAFSEVSSTGSGSSANCLVNDNILTNENVSKIFDHNSPSISGESWNGKINQTDEIMFDSSEEIGKLQRNKNHQSIPNEQDSSICADVNHTMPENQTTMKSSPEFDNSNNYKYVNCLGKKKKSEANVISRNCEKRILNSCVIEDERRTRKSQRINASLNIQYSCDNVNVAVQKFSLCSNSRKIKKFEHDKLEPMIPDFNEFSNSLKFENVSVKTDYSNASKLNNSAEITVLNKVLTSKNNKDAIHFIEKDFRIVRHKKRASKKMLVKTNDSIYELSNQLNDLEQRKSDTTQGSQTNFMLNSQLGIISKKLKKLNKYNVESKCKRKRVSKRRKKDVLGVKASVQLYNAKTVDQKGVHNIMSGNGDSSFLNKVSSGNCIANSAIIKIVNNADLSSYKNSSMPTGVDAMSTTDYNLLNSFVNVVTGLESDDLTAFVKSNPVDDIFDGVKSEFLANIFDSNSSVENSFDNSSVVSSLTASVILPTFSNQRVSNRLRACLVSDNYQNWLDVANHSKDPLKRTIDLYIDTYDNSVGKRARLNLDVESTQIRKSRLDKNYSLLPKSSDKLIPIQNTLANSNSAQYDKSKVNSLQLFESDKILANSSKLMTSVNTKFKSSKRPNYNSTKHCDSEYPSTASKEKIILIDPKSTENAFNNFTGIHLLSQIENFLNIDELGSLHSIRSEMRNAVKPNSPLYSNNTSIGNSHETLLIDRNAMKLSNESNLNNLFQSDFKLQGNTKTNSTYRVANFSRNSVNKNKKLSPEKDMSNSVNSKRFISTTTKTKNLNTEEENRLSTKSVKSSEIIPKNSCNIYNINNNSMDDKMNVENVALIKLHVANPVNSLHANQMSNSLSCNVTSSQTNNSTRGEILKSEQYSNQLKFCDNQLQLNLRSDRNKSVGTYSTNSIESTGLLMSLISPENDLPANNYPLKVVDLNSRVRSISNNNQSFLDAPNLNFLSQNPSTQSHQLYENKHQSLQNIQSQFIQPCNLLQSHNNRYQILPDIQHPIPMPISNNDIVMDVHCQDSREEIISNLLNQIQYYNNPDALKYACNPNSSFSYGHPTIKTSQYHINVTSEPNVYANTGLAMNLHTESNPYYQVYSFDTVGNSEIRDNTSNQILGIPNATSQWFNVVPAYQVSNTHLLDNRYISADSNLTNVLASQPVLSSDLVNANNLSFLVVNNGLSLNQQQNQVVYSQTYNHMPQSQHTQTVYLPQPCQLTISPTPQQQLCQQLQIDQTPFTNLNSLNFVQFPTSLNIGNNNSSSGSVPVLIQPLNQYLRQQ